ncbi:MAG: rhomboid family intramembrane serine protease [bacterium]
MYEYFFDVSFIKYGLLPGEISGLIGILTFPLIHANFNHLISNSMPILFLGMGTGYFYPSSSYKVYIPVFIVPGIFMWFFARPSYHIGASAIIYGLAAFIFFSGILKRDVRSIALALLVTFLYGGMIWGVLPLDREVSWEGHLFGAITGIICAFIFKNLDPYKKYDWEDEERDYDVRDLEVSYDKEPPF